MSYQLFCITLIAIFVFLIFEDPNIPKFIELMGKLLYINIMRFFIGTKMRWTLRWQTYWLKRSMKKYLETKKKESE